MVLCVQGLTTSCRATLAAIVDVGTVGEEEMSENECDAQCNAAPYPQLPAGYDQSSFYVQLGNRDQSAIDAQRGACMGSDTAAKPMKALLTVETVPQRPRPCVACLQRRQRWNSLAMRSSSQCCAEMHRRKCRVKLGGLSEQVIRVLEHCLEWEASLMPG